MTEKKDNLSLTRDEIDALGFDEWIDYMRRYIDKWDLHSSHRQPPSADYCLRIIRKGWEGGSDDAADALIALAEIMRGKKPIEGPHRTQAFERGLDMMSEIALGQPDAKIDPRLN